VLTISQATELGSCLLPFNGHFVAVQMAMYTAYITLTLNLSGKF